MKNSLQLFFFSCLLFCSCSMETEKEAIEKWKEEILETEQSFSNMARDEGIRSAFLNYSAENAVLMRNNSLVIGKKAITVHFENQKSKDNDVSLTWNPEFVDVSESGDLGYTYGHYIYSYIDSSGNTNESKGIFHTVWKRQPNGTWRFVWD
jgi:ketosteroid isomerase-like protein